MMDGCCARKNCYELYGADFMLTSDLRCQRHTRLDSKQSIGSNNYGEDPYYGP